MSRTPDSSFSTRLGNAKRKGALCAAATDRKKSTIGSEKSPVDASYWANGRIAAIELALTITNDGDNAKGLMKLS